MSKRVAFLLPFLLAAAGASHAAPPTVDALGGVTLSTTTGLCTAIALDSLNTVHVVYHDPTDQAVKYLTRVNGTPAWGTPVAVDSNIGHIHSTATAMALDVNRRPRVVFHDQTDGALRYTLFTGTAWQTQAAPIDVLVSTDSFPAMVLTPAGQPRVLYNDSFNRDVKYALSNDDGVTWSTFTISDSSMVFRSDIALDAAGRVHVALNLFEPLSSEQRIIYGRETTAGSNAFQGGFGVFTVVGDATTLSTGTVSLAVDANGIGHIAAFDAFTGDLLYLRGTTDTVSAITVITAGLTGESNDIALTSLGRPLITYTDGGVGLGLATCNQAICDDSTDWTLTALDATPTAGAGVSVLRNSFNNIFAAYFDAGVPELRFVTTANRGLSFSGTVRDAAAAPLPGVTITFGGSIASSSTVTPAGGTYAFADLFEGNYGVVPSYPGYGFVPDQAFFGSMTSSQVADFVGGPVGFEQVDNMIDPTKGETVTMSISVLEGNAFVGVYTLGGRLVKKLMNEVKPIGTYALSWDGRNEEGEIVASGIYLVRVQSTRFKKVLKVAVVK